LKKEPIKHHYIPQFILRNFCDERGYVNYFDKVSKEITSCKPKDIFMEKNLYRDEINCAENPTKIETDLARFEQEISKLIKEKFLDGDRVFLTKEEDEKLKLFFAIMGFRSYNAMSQFSKGLSKKAAKMYAKYQNNGDFLDMWKRNLGYLVNCRSGEEVLNHKEIDEPIKIFMMRDMYGLWGTYLVVVEKKEEEGFVIGDTYPVVVTETTMQDIQLPMYTINPLSPSRAILVVGNRAKDTLGDILGFRPAVLNKPSWNDAEQIVTIRVKRLYPEEVQKINYLIANSASNRVIFRQ